MLFLCILPSLDDEINISSLLGDFFHLKFNAVSEMEEKEMKLINKRKFTSLVLAICVSIANISVAFASSDAGQTTVLAQSNEATQSPATEILNQEITQTAEYLKGTVKLDASVDFYNSSKILILLLRSGINCTDLVNSYLTQVSTTYLGNGNLTFLDPITDYAYFSIILALSGNDATNYHGIPVIEKLESTITNASQTSINEINPYKLTILYQAVHAYAKDFKNSTLCLSKLKTALLTYANENGINYWGNSTDNNGFVLSGLSMLYTSDESFTTLVKNALTFSQTLLVSNGASAGDFIWSTQPNSDSTSASLILYSTYGKPDLAAKSYAGLLTFKTAGVNGGFSYMASDVTPSIYSTIDALFAMLSYRSVLSNEPAPYNVSDYLDKSNETPIKNPEEEQESINQTPDESNSDYNSDNSSFSNSEVALKDTTDNESSQLSASPKTFDTSTYNFLLIICILSGVYLVNAGFSIFKLRFNNK